MTHNSFKFLLPIGYIVLASCVVGAQIRSKEDRKKLFEQVANDEKAVAVCAKAAREEQIKKFGKPRPRIYGHCYDGCPIRVVKPYYPEAARRLKIRGEVLVDTIVDENGNVVFAEVTKGSGFFRKAALEAAYISQYQPKLTCGKRPIKFRWSIKYYFYPDM